MSQNRNTEGAETVTNIKRANLAQYLTRTFTNTEGPDGAVLTGHAYISAIMRVDAPVNRATKRASTDKIRLARPEKCGHINRICLACAYQWGWDYALNWDATAGGRDFRKELIAIGLDPEAIASGDGTEPREGE